MSIFGPPNVDRMKARSDVKNLIKVLRSSKDRMSVTKAAAALGEVGDDSAVEPLLVARGAEDDTEAHAAVDALVTMAARVRDADLKARLLELWITELHPEGMTSSRRRIHYEGDDDEFNRSWAREESRGISDQHVWDLGVRRRTEAARALGLLREPHAVEPLVKSLKTHGNGMYDVHTRIAVIHSLGQIEDSRAVGALQECLKDWDERVRDEAARSLSRLGISPSSVDRQE